MKANVLYKSFLSVLIISIVATSCNNAPVKEKSIEHNDQNKKQILNKPPSSFQDTLKINEASAIFYHPDSLQLLKIKEITDERIYEGQMHEFYSMMRNARLVLKKDWPRIRIIEAKNIRYLLFISKGTEPVLIDLNKKNDPYGLFLFIPGKEPHYADMMNIDTELPVYFSK
jgi:hypothetical protein